uniref:Uncharacterized protein n=1 Tax=Sciurus vulgaris TaxID=55149 RepID=A0A8D2AG53_SCIVU
FSSLIEFVWRGECVGPDSGGRDSLQNLLSGVAQMKELITQIFRPLGQQEAQDRVAPDEGLDPNDEDDADNENKVDHRTHSEGPSAKRGQMNFYHCFLFLI